MECYSRYDPKSLLPTFVAMEDWEIDFEWLRVQHLVQATMKREILPDLNTVLFLIGIQELGRWKRDFTKEEKQDLMHIAVCRLLEHDGYFEFVGRDEDGWPHYTQVVEMPDQGIGGQEKMLKLNAIIYFKDWEKGTESTPEPAQLRAK